jgi:hypothetical protein
LKSVGSFGLREKFLKKMLDSKILLLYVHTMSTTPYTGEDGWTWMNDPLAPRFQFPDPESPSNPALRPGDSGYEDAPFEIGFMFARYEAFAAVDPAEEGADQAIAVQYRRADPCNVEPTQINYAEGMPNEYDPWSEHARKMYRKFCAQNPVPVPDVRRHL